MMSHSVSCFMFGVLAVMPSTLAGQTLRVEVIDRKNGESTYSYTVPGYSTSTGQVNCSLFPTNALCNGSTATTTTPARVVSYQLTGATLTLRLPDGRVAVVNCEKKLDWTGWGTFRDCRVPLAADITAEFDRDNAKLSWRVSLDGSKTQSETYKILGVLTPDAFSPVPAMKVSAEALADLTRLYPDWRTYETKMQQLSMSIRPIDGASELDFLIRLYRLASGKQ